MANQIGGEEGEEEGEENEEASSPMKKKLKGVKLGTKKAQGKKVYIPGVARYFFQGHFKNRIRRMQKSRKKK